jgi:hypothetical protein
MAAAAAAPPTPSRFRGSIVPKAPPTPPPKRQGTNQAALAELRNATATYEFLRRKGDPAEFWEMLRLARSRRAIVAPAEGAAPAPSAEVEAAIVHELDSLRRQVAPFVRDLRKYLANVPALPEPFDRFEMALAFLLASAREHQAVAKWLAEPGRHEARAAEKLRSLAAITDPYREALQPWSLSASPPAVPPTDPPAVQFSEMESPAPPLPPGAPAASTEASPLETVRRAMECWRILDRIRLEAHLWEMVLIAGVLPQTAKTVLEQLSKTLNGDLRQQAEADTLAIEALYQAAGDLRRRYGDWVRSLRAALEDRGLAPEDPRAFEVGLGLMLATPGAQHRLASWLEEPATWHEETLGLLNPWMRHGQDFLSALK